MIYNTMCKALTSDSDICDLSIPLLIAVHERAVIMHANNPYISPQFNSVAYFLMPSRSALIRDIHNLL